MHALKGTAWSIGAGELGNFAEQLESAAKKGENSAITEGNPKLLKLITKLNNEIAAAISARRKKTEIQERIDVSLLRLDMLKNALAAMDIEAVNRILMEYLSINMDSATRAAIEKIEKHILMFEYDQAIELINEM
jgi:HPt (histidine-containing phosphotransfer) domain-containing protein